MSEHVTIIGAGIVGICTAISLLEKGFEVVLIDRDGPAKPPAFWAGSNRVVEAEQRGRRIIILEVAFGALEMATESL